MKFLLQDIDVIQKVRGSNKVQFNPSATYTKVPNFDSANLRAILVWMPGDF